MAVGVRMTVITLAGELAELDDVVPLTQAPQVGNKITKLEMVPAALNRRMGATVGEKQLAMAKKFRDAGLISEVAMVAVQARFLPLGTEKYQLQEQ